MKSSVAVELSVPLQGEGPPSVALYFEKVSEFAVCILETGAKGPLVTNQPPFASACDVEQSGRHGM